MLSSLLAVALTLTSPQSDPSASPPPPPATTTTTTTTTVETPAGSAGATVGATAETPPPPPVNTQPSAAALDPDKFRVVTADDAPFSPAASMLISLAGFGTGIALQALGYAINSSAPNSTLIGIGGLVSLLGPNFGDAANGDIGRMLLRAFVRLAITAGVALVGAILFVIGGLQTVGNTAANVQGGNATIAISPLLVVGIVVMVASAIVYLIMSVYDIVASGDAPERWAERDNRRRGVQMPAAPTPPAESRIPASMLPTPERMARTSIVPTTPIFATSF